MYTKEETEKLIKDYLDAEDKKEVVTLLAEELGKSTKSIIGKLSREGVYVKQTYVSKTGDPPVTKLELVAKLAEANHLELKRLEGLDKAPKNALKYLVQELGLKP